MVQESRHSGHWYSDSGPCRNGHRSPQSASALCRWVPWLEAEAKAMDVAASFAWDGMGWDVGVQEVIFERDSHVIFTALSGPTIPPATVIDVLESIQQKLHDFSL